jgi:predicted ester cyclase
MSTTTQGTTGTDLEANKAVVRSFIDTVNTRDFDRYTALMGADAVLHIGRVDVPIDPAGTRAIAEQWSTAFPDWRFELRDLIAEGDRVVAYMPYSGTHCHTIIGVDATGRSCIVDEIVIFRVTEGKIVEAWEVSDEAGMWRQLGVKHLP